MIAKANAVKAKELEGYTHLVYRGQSYFVKLNEEESVEKFKQYLESITNTEWGVFREEIGEEHLVLYRKDLFEVYTDDVKLIKELSYIGDFTSEIELPINCSCCSGMFEGKKFPPGFVFGKEFNTSNIVNMNGMFRGCEFPEGFTLGSEFDTKNVENMGEMFSHCTFGRGFNFGEKFYTGNTVYMYRMFYACEFPENFVLGSWLTTEKAKYIDEMFRECKFSYGFRLSSKFEMGSVKSKLNVFTDSKGKDGTTLQIFGEDSSSNFLKSGVECLQSSHSFLQ